MKLFGIKESDIIKKVNDEYIYWFNHIEQKRETRREDLLLYVKESQEDVVDIHSIYTTVQTLMSINYLNELSVEFTKRKNWDAERAVNANICAEYDYNEMWLDVLDYTWEMNRLLTWVGIQTNWDFDYTSIHPTIKNVDTLSYIFDPKGWATIKDHRFFGIESEMTKEEMKEAWFENYKELWIETSPVDENADAVNRARQQGFTDEIIDNSKFKVYIHGTIFKGEKYIAVLNNGKNKILDFKKLLPVFEEEKKDPSKIMFPIALKYFSYLPWDSMGISPFDLLRSKQGAYSAIFNLMLKMAYKNASGWDRLINSDKITDMSGLATPTLDGKDIPVSLWMWEDIWNVISYIQKDTPTALPTELKEWLSQETILDSGIDRNTQWVLAQGNNTLGEREMAQKNANLRFLLWSKQANWGEIFRWKYLYYRQYAANLKSVDKKEFALETGYSEDFHAFSKDDFVWSDLLHLKIQSKAEIEQERQSMKADRIATYPQEIAEAQATGSKYRLIMLQRDRLRDMGESEMRVMKRYPYTEDELKAMDSFKAIKFAIWLEDWPIKEQVIKDATRIGSLDEDHNVWIEYYQTLPEGKIKRGAIKTRYDAIKKKDSLMWQEMQWPVEAWTWWSSAGNVATAMATNNQLQGTQNWPSLTDITQ